MSGLVEKVKEKVRGRSRSRKRTAQHEAKTSSEVQRSSYTDTMRSQNSAQDASPRVSNPSMPAWHVHKGGWTPVESHDIPRKPLEPAAQEHAATLQTDPTNQTRHVDRSSYNADSEGVPARSTSIQNRPQAVEQENPEAQNANSALQYPYTVPRRKESLPQNRIHRKSDSAEQRRSQQINLTTGDRDRLDQDIGVHNQQMGTAPERTRGNGELPAQETGRDLGVEIDRALASLSVDDHRGQQTTGAQRAGGQSQGYNEHLRLPQGFSLGHSETTTIDTEWKPAVTHENIYRERTEVVREAITRDIHIHHYYTYVQPIKVLEVLPAKHYMIDETTGMKVEIAAPEGWEMPQDLRPRREDAGQVKGWERHYLVNEQYPEGIPEPSPTQLRKRLSSKHHGNKYATASA